MEYMILIHSDESYEMPAPGTPEFDAMMGEWAAYNQRLIDGGHWVSGANLQPTVTATVVRKSTAPHRPSPTARSPRARNSSAATTWSVPTTSTRRSSWPRTSPSPSPRWRSVRWPSDPTPTDRVPGRA
jgi:hypothetical protein